MLDAVLPCEISRTIQLVLPLRKVSVSRLQGTISASTTLHDRVLSIILKSPMTFFDTMPTGRIINRFSKDLDEGMSISIVITVWLSGQNQRKVM